MTSKQRSRLRSIAATVKPVAQVGKGGLSETLIQGLSEALEARELIKVTLLPNSDEDADNLAANIADLLQAELVTVIGRKAVFYRRSEKKDIRHLEF